MHPATRADWTVVDGTLRGLALAKAQLDSEIGRWLIAAQRTKPWEKCGMRSIYEYFERIFGWAPHTIAERLRTAAELVTLPELDAELASGRMSFSHVRELTRVATSQTEREWIDWATRKTAGEVAGKVARHARGERPTDRGDVSRVKKRMVLNFSADQHAMVMAAIALMRKHDPTLTEEECVRNMAVHAAEAMTKETAGGEAPARPFRVQMEIGLDGSSFVKGIGEERHEVSPALAECAQCDAEVWIRRPDGTVERLRVAVPQPMRRLVFEHAKGRCEVCGIRLKPQLHHLWLVSEGGKHDVERMIALCPSHHDRVHEGSLWIRGTRSSGFTFTMADGSPYGSGAPTPMAAMHVEVFQGLRTMGFKELEIRPVLEALRERDLPIEELLRVSLKMLHQQRNRPTRDETPAPAIDVESDAREGLRGLGFTEGEMTPVLAALRGRALPLPELLRQSLQMLHRRRAGEAGGRPTGDDAKAAAPRPSGDAPAVQVPAAAVACPSWDENEERPDDAPAMFARPAWDRPPVRKYKMNPPENDGVAEPVAVYRARPIAALQKRGRRPVLGGRMISRNRNPGARARPRRYGGRLATAERSSSV